MTLGELLSGKRLPGEDWAVYQQRRKSANKMMQRRRQGGGVLANPRR